MKHILKKSYEKNIPPTCLRFLLREPEARYVFRPGMATSLELGGWVSTMMATTAYPGMNSSWLAGRWPITA